MIRRPQTIGFWEGRLPHWEVEEGRYFVTVHLAGAIPVQGQQRIRRMSADLNQVDCTQGSSGLALSRTIFREMEVWLDRATYNPLLQVPAIAQMVIEAIQHRAQIACWDVHEYVVMPNHIHLFLSVLQGTLRSTMEDFKRWTGHQAAKLIELPNARFWQKEWFDHWSRSDEQDERIVRYIQQNAVAAGLVKTMHAWPYGSWNQ